MKNERTLRMMENYGRHFFEEGKEPKEIAEMYNLSVATVYSTLSEIAAGLGLAREELLKRPHDEHIMGAREYQRVKPVDIGDFRAKMLDFENYMASINDTISRTIEEHEELGKIIEEEDEK